MKYSNNSTKGDKRKENDLNMIFIELKWICKSKSIIFRKKESLAA